MTHTVQLDESVSSRTAPKAPFVPRKSRRLDALLNIILFATVGIGVVIYNFPVSSHELYASPSTYEFKSVKAGATVHTTFTLRNLHPWTIMITGVNSSCGCTKAFIGKKTPFSLAPFGAVQIETSLATKFKQGQITENVQVITSDNAQGTTLQLRGGVQ